MADGVTDEWRLDVHDTKHGCLVQLRKVHQGVVTFAARNSGDAERARQDIVQYLERLTVWVREQEVL